MAMQDGDRRAAAALPDRDTAVGPGAGVTSLRQGGNGVDLAVVEQQHLLCLARFK
jgi:hypothetical protein